MRRGTDVVLCDVSESGKPGTDGTKMEVAAGGKAS